RHTRSDRDWSSDVCSSDLAGTIQPVGSPLELRVINVLTNCFTTSTFQYQLPCAVPTPTPTATLATPTPTPTPTPPPADLAVTKRSEERRVGKECRARGSA